LSVAQVSGVLIATLAGMGVWYLVALLAPPAEVGILGKVISTSIFIASVVTAGLGQFYLTVIRSTSVTRLRRYFWLGLILGSVIAGIAAIAIGTLQSGGVNQVAISTGLLCIGVAITNLQDSLYLGTGLAIDVPAKSAAILIFRLFLLLGLASFNLDLFAFLFIFVISQLIIGVGWVLIRAPLALARHASRMIENSQENNLGITLTVSYLYALAITAVTMGVPALVTSLSLPATAGEFYLAWILAGLLGSIAIAIANSVLALSIGQNQPARRLTRILFSLAGIMLLGSLFISILLPSVVVRLDQHYREIPALFRMLSAGNIFFGITLVLLAAYRTFTIHRQLVLILVAWPLVIAVSVLLGLLTGDIEAGAMGFVISAGFTAVPICILTYRTLLKSDHKISNTLAEAIDRSIL